MGPSQVVASEEHDDMVVAEAVSTVPRNQRPSPSPSREDS